jgi:hypothetical protein
VRQNIDIRVNGSVFSVKTDSLMVSALAVEWAVRAEIQAVRAFSGGDFL